MRAPFLVGIPRGYPFRCVSKCLYTLQGFFVYLYLHKDTFFTYLQTIIYQSFNIFNYVTI